MFSATSLPPWLTIDPATGVVAGTPGPADVGTYTNFVLRVSDGTTSAMLGPFAISVLAVGTGSATLSWTPPTTNTDGSPLTDLAGYRIYWGTSPDDYDSITVNNPGLTTYVVDGLTSGTWYFAATALNDDGLESGLSNAASKEIP